MLSNLNFAQNSKVAIDFIISILSTYGNFSEHYSI